MIVFNLTEYALTVFASSCLALMCVLHVVVRLVCIDLKPYRLFKVIPIVAVCPFAAA